MTVNVLFPYFCLFVALCSYPVVLSDCIFFIVYLYGNMKPHPLPTYCTVCT
eukprot:m.158460 g.158460  ORF g.158460 m.158460 type:complete len:51 (-) comp13353_c0_seq10:4400-4552(-)